MKISLSHLRKIISEEITRNALLEAEGNEKVEVAKERAEKILDWITSGDGKYDPGAPDSEHYEDNLDSIIKLSMSYGSAGKKPGPEKQELTTMIKAELDTLLRKTEPTNSVVVPTATDNATTTGAKKKAEKAEAGAVAEAPPTTSRPPASNTPAHPPCAR